MNMISTGAFLPEMDASNKQETTAEKFARVWEKKNAKAARAGGVSLMALSLAACGGSSEEAAAPEVEAPAEPEAPAVTPFGDPLTANNDVFTDLTTVADSIAATSATYGENDTIVDDNAGDGDTLTVTATDDIAVTPNIVGIENIVFNFDAFTTAAATGTVADVDVDGIASGTVTINVDQFSSNIVAGSVTNAGAITVVAGTDIATLTVSMNEDAGTVVNAGDATAVNITSEAGDDQVATLVANGDATLTLADTADTMTDVNITATEASSITIVNNAAIDTITGDANTTLTAADIAVFDGMTITGAAAVSAVGGAATDVTGITSAIAITDAVNQTLTVADGASVEAETIGTVLTLTADDDADATTENASAVTVTLSDDSTNAATYGITLAASATSDEINTVNVVASGTLTANAGADLTVNAAANANDTTINLSGAGDVDMAVTAGGDEEVTLNAAALTGALTVTAQDVLLTITGGSGDDTITADTGEAFALDGGAGNDTLGLVADMTAGTFTNFEAVTGTGDFLASQLNGLNAVAITGSTLTIGATGIDTATIDLSGITYESGAAATGVNMTGATIDTTAMVSTTALTITGTGSADTLIGGAGGDTITGGGGIDTITGGAGVDTIDLTEGTAAADIIIYAEEGAANADTVTGFTADEADDVMHIDVSAINGGNIMDTTGTVISAATVHTVVEYTVGTALASNTAAVSIIKVTNTTGINSFADVSAALDEDNITLDGGAAGFAVGEGILTVFYDADDAAAVVGYMESDTADVFDDGNTFVELATLSMSTTEYDALAAANFDIL